MDQESAVCSLQNHHSVQRYYPEYQYQKIVNIGGEYLGPYIPYIGKSYFDIRPRILIYAMSQNLGRASRLISIWLNSKDKGMLRQYHDSDTPHVHVHPYDDGHLKVIAALALHSHPETYFDADQNVDDLVVITNFVKFSFYREGKNGKRLDANPPLAIYDDMWDNYCRYEVSVLQPDIIIGVGNEVANAIKRNLERDNAHKIMVLKVPFPGRLNLNARWLPKGRELMRTENYDSSADISEMRALVRGTPDAEGRLDRAIKTDWYYFKEMKAQISEQLTKHV